MKTILILVKVKLVENLILLLLCINLGLGDNDAFHVIYLWFKNFKFKYEKEYLVCDWTCLVGEIGGNFGFFLGGSVLAVFDLILGALAWSKK